MRPVAVSCENEAEQAAHGLRAAAQLALVGRRYLDFMGQAFPVMTASENFYTFPRAHAALAHTGRVETLSEPSIAHALDTVRGLLDELLRLDPARLELEDRIDWHLLWGSMCTFIRDFGRRRVWQSDPVMYLKILNLCCGQNPLIRLPQVPALLAEARRNLGQVPRTALEIALAMLSGDTGITQRVDRLMRQWGVDGQHVCAALVTFERFLRHELMPRATGTFATGQAEFEDALRTFAGIDLTVDGVWHRGRALYDQADDALRAVAARLGGSLSIEELGAQLREKHGPAMEVEVLYARSAARVRDFLRCSAVLTVPDDGDYTFDVVGTPDSWMAVKSTAGYNCPRGQTRAVLHINLGTPRLHADHLLTIAHELYPGHHLQGIIARRNPRFIRRQFEMPIFYEGWATYAEKLMVEQGFWPEEAARFFYWKLRKLRAARTMVDVGLHTERLTLDEARQVLVEAHVPEQRASRQVRRYTITPAYQLSYAIGLDQVERLRTRFEPQLGLRRFHDVVLQGGDMPWRWVEARLERAATSPQGGAEIFYP